MRRGSSLRGCRSLYFRIVLFVSNGNSIAVSKRICFLVEVPAVNEVPFSFVNKSVIVPIVGLESDMTIFFIPSAFVIFEDVNVT